MHNCDRSSLTLLFLILSCSTLAVSNPGVNSEEIWKEKMEKLKAYVQENKIQEENNKIVSYGVGTEFFNITISNNKPTSVHRLRPADIDVIAAMGDSITAANGANASTVAGIIREFRGVSWSVGGEGALENTLSLPNILRLFNPKLKGYSLGTQFSEDRNWWLNVAVPGAKASDMTSQATRLVNLLKDDPQIDFENDWKIVTIFIGGNDLCDLNRYESSQPENYIKSLQDGLDILHTQLKRTLVNVVDIIEFYLLREIGYGYGSTPACRAMQRFFCNYIITADEEDTEIIRKKNKEYQDLTHDLINSGRYDTRDDFTVVIQPFFKNTVLPYTEDGQVDSTFFAPDCFHFSLKGHALGALNLWNNMLEPVGQKSTEWVVKDLRSPSENSPYIFTNRNSGNNVAGETTLTSREEWLIVVIIVLVVALFIELVFLTVFVCKNKKKKTEIVKKIEKF